MAKPRNFVADHFSNVFQLSLHCIGTVLHEISTKVDMLRRMVRVLVRLCGMGSCEDRNLEIVNW